MLIILENNIISPASALSLRDFITPIFILLGWLFVNHQNKTGFLRKELRDNINSIQESYLELRTLTFSFYLDSEEFSPLNKQEIMNSLELIDAKLNSLTCQNIIPIDSLKNIHWELYSAITDTAEFDTKEISKDNFNASEIDLDSISLHFCNISTELEKYFMKYTETGALKSNFLKIKHKIANRSKPI